MAAKQVALILGAGGNVGSAVSRSFKDQGYAVAVASRVHRPEQHGEYLHVAADLSNPDGVPAIFDKVKNELGVPSVVVYNAASVVWRDSSDPLGLTNAEFSKSLAVNAISLLAAARAAVAGFATLPASAPRTFIFTGNALNRIIMPAAIDLGMGKSAAAHLIGASAQAYGPKGYRFYYADERAADGSPVYNNISGQAHADFFLQLSKGEVQTWDATFVKDKGYVKF